jgi:acyl-[acyl-carrier-protein]-phospholipid O-acyltransferase / long-chain-fatty-acid--[acyl-carrier-protein] ligase
MIWTGAAIAAFVGLWLAYAGFLAHGRRIDLRQAILYAPLKLLFLVRDDRLPESDPDRGTLYVVSHRSRLDPAFMLTLLPSDTLHILDHEAATAWWMEPFRELARTIPFNATHVFVSRRLVRILRGNGRIAVYLPENPEPDTRSFRLFRAVARIALKADAAVVPVRLGHPGRAISDRPIGERVNEWPSRPLAITTLAPATIDALRQRIGAGTTTASNALFDRVAQTRIADADRFGSVFRAVAGTARRFGEGQSIVRGPDGRTISWSDLMASTRLLARHLADATERGDRIGLLLQDSPHLAAGFLATQSAGLTAAMLAPDIEPETTGRTIRAGSIRLVLTSRTAADATPHQLHAAIESAGARLLLVEDILEGAGAFALFCARLARHRPVSASGLDDPAAEFLVAGDGRPARLVQLSQRNMLDNAAQVGARVDFNGGGDFLSLYPPHDATGLTAGVLTPLLAGAGSRIAPMGERHGGTGQPPGLILAPGSCVGEWLRDHGSLPAETRAIICMDAPLAPSVREALAAGSGLVLKALAFAEASGIVALSSRSHRRAAGRLLPGMRARLEPVAGLERGGRLTLAGPNVATGWMDPEQPGQIERPEGGWLDTGLLASLDNEGFVTVHGKADRLARIGDTEIPLALAEMLATTQWPKGVHVAVALPDRRRGERIALVTTEPNADKAALRRQAKAVGVAEIAVPSEIFVFDTMPLDAGGRPDVGEVRRLAEATQARSRAA